MSHRRITLPHIVAGIFLLIALVAAFFLAKEIARRQSNGPGNATYRSVEETEWGSKVTHGGKTYVQKEGLTTVLLLGIDDSKTPDPHVIGDGYRSDALVLLILNDKTKTMQTLSISRDTITKVAMYDNKGDYITDGTMRSTCSTPSAKARGVPRTLPRKSFPNSSAAGASTPTQRSP